MTNPHNKSKDPITYLDELSEEVADIVIKYNNIMDEVFSLIEKTADKINSIKKEHVREAILMTTLQKLVDGVETSAVAKIGVLMITLLRTFDMSDMLSWIISQQALSRIDYKLSNT